MQTVAKDITEPPANQELAAIEQDMMDLCLRISKFIGLPKSVGELYGFLFVSQEPKSMDELTSQLNLSKGATSQGLKVLRTIGAIKTVYIAGERKDYFQAETNLSKLVSGFLKDRIEPGVTDLGHRISTLSLPDEDSVSNSKLEFIKGRMQKLASWQQKTADAVPALSKFLTGS
ncbi:MAG: hypothetical protein AAF984_07480 [Verrucomicrobiota bacterium]